MSDKNDSQASARSAEASVEAAGRALARAIAQVGAATENVRNGGVADLSTLDETVRDLCAHAENSVGSDRQALRPQLMVLVSDLDALAERMKAQQSDIRKDLDKTGQRQRATDAYSRPSRKKP
ncbi:MAG: hypothetical protein RIE31_02765 [Alphaproteobacteria bacterium]